MMSVKNRTIRKERYLVMQAIATETAAISELNLRGMLPRCLCMSLWTRGIRNRQCFGNIVKLDKQGDAKDATPNMLTRPCLKEHAEERKTKLRN